MANDSPAAILYSSDGIEIGVLDSVSLPSDTRGYISVGLDDSNYTKFLRVDASGRQVVVGAAADGVAVSGYPVLIAGWDGANVRTILTGTDGSIRVKGDFADDRDKIVGATFQKDGITATTYYDFIDINGSSYKHGSGTAVYMSRIVGQALKSNSGAKWVIQLMVVLRIDGTDSDLGLLSEGLITLKDTSTFRGEIEMSTFPVFLDLSTSGGDFTSIADGSKETGVTAINTGVTIDDIFGSSVTPAVGDVLLRVTLLSGGGTLDFAYSTQYFVE